MATIILDALGLKCPQPVLKIAAKSVEMFNGDTLVSRQPFIVG